MGLIIILYTEIFSFIETNRIIIINKRNQLTVEESV